MRWITAAGLYRGVIGRMGQWGLFSTNINLMYVYSLLNLSPSLVILPSHKFLGGHGPVPPYQVQASTVSNSCYKNSSSAKIWKSSKIGNEKIHGGKEVVWNGMEVIGWDETIWNEMRWRWPVKRSQRKERIHIFVCLFMYCFLYDKKIISGCIISEQRRREVIDRNR